jgi:hypothetical protein
VFLLNPINAINPQNYPAGMSGQSIKWAPVSK